MQTEHGDDDSDATRRYDDSDATREYGDVDDDVYEDPDDDPDEPPTLLATMAEVSGLDQFRNSVRGPDAQHYLGGLPEMYHEVDTDLSDPLELYWQLPTSDENEYLMLRFLANGQTEAVIQKEMNVLSSQEALQHEAECRKAMLDELRRWHSLKSFRRSPRRTANNLLDSRWVLKWKMIDGERRIKARLTVRGYRDMQAPELDTYSATTTRWGQRMVSAIAAINGWSLFSADISQAFLRGLTFEQLLELDPKAKPRQVQFTVPPGSAGLLRELPGLENFNELTECLEMLRAGFGLKDAPRLWNRLFTRVLRRCNMVPTKADPQLFLRHDDDCLTMILSTHVDDLKGAGTDERRKELIALLKKEFGDLKEKLHSFECIGVMHEQDPITKTVRMHQAHYIDQLRLLSLDPVAMAKPEDLAPPTLASDYCTLVGGIAWTAQTIPAACVYISYLQRQLKHPSVQNLREANRLLKWLKLHGRKGLLYTRRPGPYRLVVITDSAFKAGDTAGLAIRGYILCLMCGTGTTDPGGYPLVLDYFSRRQSHVCRSTYAAELHALLDGTNQALLIRNVFSEIMQGPMTAAELSDAQLHGRHPMAVWACIDAKAVFDSIVGEPVKTPADAHLLVHALKVREWLDDGNLGKLWWVDTRDMVTDGMTKGVVNRSALLLLAEGHRWTFTGQAPVQWPR